MNAQIIEKLDKARYNAWLVQTIGFGLFVGLLITQRITNNESTSLFVATGVGVLAFLAGTFWKNVVFQKIRSDSKTKEALNNELYIQYGYKTYYWAFWAFLLALLILIYVARFLSLDTTTACLIAIYTGALTRQIATLVYYRR